MGKCTIKKLRAGASVWWSYNGQYIEDNASGFLTALMISIFIGLAVVLIEGAVIGNLGCIWFLVTISLSIVYAVCRHAIEKLCELGG